MLDRALRESEERFRTVFEGAGIGMALINATGRFIQVNESLCQFLGYTAEELLSKDIHAINHPENMPSSHVLLRKLGNGETERGDFERRYLRKDGSTVWASATIGTAHDADGHITCIVSQYKDITKRKSAEEALRRSESLFHAITNNVEDLIMLIDGERKWRYASPSHLGGLGYAPEELLGSDALCLVHPDDRALAERALGDILKDGHGRVVAVRCRHKNGSLRHFESRGALLRGTSGQSEGIVVVSRIIDDRMLTEEKLRAAHAETELFLQSIPSILIGLDHQGHITHWNPTAAQILGLPSSEAIGRLIDDCGVKWLHPEMGLEVNRWLQTETVHTSEHLAYEREGQVRFLGLTVRPLSVPENDPRRFLITGADVTERKTLEAQLRQTQKLEAIGQLAAGIAHEINTPTQYVGDNTRFLKESWEWIAKLLELSATICQLARKGAVSNQPLEEFEKLAQQADLEYLLKEVPARLTSLWTAFNGWQDRRGMKEFSHPGSEEKRAIDINKAIKPPSRWRATNGSTSPMWLPISWRIFLWFPV